MNIYQKEPQVVEYDSSIIGSQGKGCLWNDENSDHDDQDPRNVKISSLAYDISNVKISDSESSASIISKESDDESFDLDEPSYQEAFSKEVVLTLERAFNEGHTVDIAALELNTLRMASNMTFHDVRTVVIPSVLSQIDIKKNVSDPKEMNIRTKEVLNRWAPLIGKLILSPSDQLDALYILQEYCAKDESHVKLLAPSLKFLYDLDVIEEDAIIRWYKSDRSKEAGRHGNVELNKKLRDKKPKKKIEEESDQNERMNKRAVRKGLFVSESAKELYHRFIMSEKNVENSELIFSMSAQSDLLYFREIGSIHSPPSLSSHFLHHMASAMNITFSLSAERPFGIYLNDYFVQGCEFVLGKNPNDFVFEKGVTPVSTWNSVLLGCTTYLAMIFSGKLIMANFPPLKLKFLFQFHNLLLTGVSLALLLLFFEQLFPSVYRHGFYYSLCDHEAWTQRLELLFYLNYLVKYWELADTAFLVLRKKPLEFLHVYHHSMTMVLCYVQLVGRTSVSWVPVCLNLLIHVVMYYYYFRAAGGAKIWWKKYLTTMQITQFVLDLIVVYSCSYTHFATDYWPFMPNFGPCAGDENAAIFGCVMLSSYLLLFIEFYRKTYGRGVNRKTPSKES
ncbi:hypothetical protein G9A89_021866 [Geosiphon pyriformis]|nr:hypothetical protein G9A89_021866 [Geosiphon pyriformis]